MKIKNARTALGPEGAHPSILHAHLVIDRVWRRVVGVHAIVTGMAEEGHSEGSLHYGVLGDTRCRALDYRTRDLTQDQRHELDHEIRRRLGEGEFDVVWERSHLHVEADAR